MADGTEKGFLRANGVQETGGGTDGSLGALVVVGPNGDPLPVAQGLIPKNYDYIGLTYTGSDLTGVVYKTGGASGTTVGTLTLAYTGSNLISVTKT